MAEIKRPTVVDAEITDDGHVVVEFNSAFKPNTRKCVFSADVLIALAEDHARFRDPSETDFPEIPFVDVGDVYEVEEGAGDDDDDDDDDGDNAGEEGDGDGDRKESEA